MADVEMQLQQYASWLAARADDPSARSPDVSAASRAPGARITAESPDGEGDVVALEDRPPRRPRRVLAAFAAAAAVIALVVTLAVVARPDSAEAPAASTVPEPTVPTIAPTVPSTSPPESTVPTSTSLLAADAVVVAEPDTVAPGETVELRFSEDVVRGVAWSMTPSDTPRTGDSETAFLLVARATGYDCAECPTWHPAGDDVAVDDIGIMGVGPDTIVVPDVAMPGDYDVCTDNAPVAYCVRITVTEPNTMSTTVPEPDVTTFPFELPAGDITASGDDLFVLHADGDLYLHRGALAGATGEELLVDLTDPRAPVAEGPGPNVVDDVAGLIDGALVYADCCEPVAGNVIAVVSAGSAPEFVGYGYGPTLHPAGTHLAGANDYAVWIADLTARTSTSRTLNLDPGSYVSVVDITWTADGDRVVVLGSDGDGYVVMPFRNDASLTPLPTVRLDIPPLEGPAVLSQVAGLGPSGEIAVVTNVAEPTDVRFLDPVTFEEDMSLRRTIPEPVSSVRLAPDGQGLLWVADGELWYEPSGEAAGVLATDVTGGWFVRTASTS